jgi:hypothetical protein
MIDWQGVTTRFLTADAPPDEAMRLGFRFGPRGAHTSRTIMFDDLSAVLGVTSPEAKRQDYASAIIDANCLGKPTSSTRRLTNQRLGELYALDPSVPVFRVLRRLWDLDPAGQRLLALQCALARDPLLRATANSVVGLPIGAEFLREPMKATLQVAVGDRLNEDILNKVVRNAASSWTQSGHLEGRTLKKRRTVRPTPANGAFAVFLAYAAGFRAAEIFASGWFTVLDCPPSHGRELAVAAKRLGLIDLRMAGDIVELTLDRLDPAMTRS